MKTPNEISMTLADVLKIVDEQIDEVAELYADYGNKKGEPLFDPATQMKSMLSHLSVKIMAAGVRKSTESESAT
ncbi:hypothetical protein GZ77_09520 [Endozoicomonas montiporae]|uniref:Uncharacterized protein n=2 Tax=Endozoicomonas montiporae TaxID=1027273 RepID=A0A081N7Y6_9GAMM|nr:hypothetical protein [Endozoicomonas montiporae]AMO55574.1 hypothetical protein EZMO1_1386 [Endozoicomonas montiporae CL-33]KEQ14559.1 hypothetical protein GZ77_09520 [Endozoicomonas montiporae]